MSHYEKSKWVRVSRSAPCILCKRDTFCTRTIDGLVAKCMRIESEHSCESGGWIHQLKNPLPFVDVPDRPPRPKKDASLIAKVAYVHQKALITRTSLATKLGVSVGSLEDLLVGYGMDREGTEWASFPSRGVCGEIVGVTRRYNDGAKKTVAGTSNSGIFCKEWWWIGNGTVYIVEGPSDVAALLDAGLCVLGRPSNVGGLHVLTAYLKRRDPRRIVVMGENDAKPERRGEVESCKKDCLGCSYCAPGRFGCVTTASRLAKNLQRKVETSMPPLEFKDVRQWWIANQLKGLT